MGTNNCDMNFLVDHPQSVNEKRAGDAVEVCLATLYFTTLFPVEFLFWGDPFENYAGLEDSIRSIRSFC